MAVAKPLFDAVFRYLPKDLSSRLKSPPEADESIEKKDFFNTLTL
jgi:hypothetical protein